jgi:hypothetical protein
MGMQVGHIIGASKCLGALVGWLLKTWLKFAEKLGIIVQ